MRKALVVFVCLIVACVAGMFPLGAYLLSEKDQVKYEETIVKGDAALAEGVTVSIKGQMAYQNYWDSVYTIGKGPDTQTEYRYYSSHHHENESGVKGYGISFEYYPNFASSGGIMDYVFEGIGFGAAYEALKEQTPAGQTGSISFPIREYAEYYPVWFTVSVDAFRYDYGGTFWGRSGKEAPEEEKERVNKVFSEFFRIPVMEGEMYTITITKNANGTVTEVHGEPGEWQTKYEDAFENTSTLHGTTNGTDMFSWQTVSCWDEENLYFTFVPYSKNGREMNTELIPGGFGIYRIPYYADENGDYHLDAEQLSLLYPLEKETAKRELDLSINAAGDLLVLSGEEKNATFTVIDTETGAQVQKFQVERPEEKSLYIRHREDNFMVCMFDTEYVLVLEYGSQEGYRTCFLAEVDEDSLIAQAAKSYRHTGAYDWNGRQLLYATYGLLAIEERGGWPTRLYDTDFSVAVYDATGEVYLAEYRSSLHTEQERDPLADDGYHTTERCQNRSGLAANWEK